MSPVRGDLAPTARLRWVEREVPATELSEGGGAVTLRGMTQWRVLQQWWAADVPSYMRATAEGEWRDVPVGVEAP